MATDKLTIASYNICGLIGIDRTLTTHLLDDYKPHILLLQETWLFKRDLDTLSTIHSDYLSLGKSSVPDNKILQGMPYGGLAIFWNKTLAHQVKPIETKCDQITGVLLTLSDNSIVLIINVYLPVDNRSMCQLSDIYEQCIGELECVLNELEYHHVVIGGNYNTDFSRHNAQSGYLNNFIERNNMLSAWTVKDELHGVIVKHSLLLPMTVIGHVSTTTLYHVLLTVVLRPQTHLMPRLCAMTWATAPLCCKWNALLFYPHGGSMSHIMTVIGLHGTTLITMQIIKTCLKT